MQNLQNTAGNKILHGIPEEIPVPVLHCTRHGLGHRHGHGHGHGSGMDMEKTTANREPPRPHDSGK